jgi:hypothetical protein
MSATSINLNPERQSAAPLDEKEAASRLGISVHAMRKWRMFGKGPSYMKYGVGRGGIVRYDPGEIERFKAASVIATSGTV